MTSTPAADWSGLGAASEWARTLADAVRATTPNWSQPILPGWTFNVNSNNSSAPQTEVEVVQHYSYGKQLGRISDALAALIEAVAPEGMKAAPYVPFTEMKREIDGLKNDAAAARVDQLRADLRRLKTERPDAYERIRQSLRRTLEL